MDVNDSPNRKFSIIQDSTLCQRAITLADFRNGVITYVNTTVSVNTLL